MQIVRFLYALPIVVLLSYCETDKQKRFNEAVEIDSVVSPLASISWQDTLTVVVTFSECGEWGGHREHLSIQQDSASKLYARLVIDSVNCDSLVRYYPNETLKRYSRQQIYDSIKYLTLKDELLISGMLQKILEAHLEEGAFGANFGDLYTIKTSDGSLNLIFWNNANDHTMDYRETRNIIFENVKQH